jgi:hypothetical protein
MAVPLIVAGAIGLGQAIYGGIKASQARKALARQKAPSYTPVKSITDYYNEAQRRYQESPYQSNLYKMQAQNIARAGMQVLTALKDTRDIQTHVPALVQNQNDALLQAGVASEQQRDQRFAQLGSATGAMSSDQERAWQINHMLPYQARRDILGQQAGGYTQVMNAGLQNIYTGLSGMSSKGAGTAKSKGTISVGNPTSYSSYETPFQ